MLMAPTLLNMLVLLDLHLIQSSLSHDLEKLSKLLLSNRLDLNATKTEFIDRLQAKIKYSI